MTIGDVVAALDRIAPFALAEPWDNVGLLLGDLAAACDRVVVALEADRALLARAVRTKAQLIVTHHPPIFRPLGRITADDATGALVLEAARQGIALAAAHTNYDVAPDGVSSVLAGLLGLKDTQPLARAERGAQAKLVVFTPAGDLDAVLAALDDAGAGIIGNYRQCTFRSPGTGSFLPLEGAAPTLGRVGRREEVEELRVEAVVPLAIAGRTVAAVRRAHSYEEPAIDVVPLEGRATHVGIGLVGALPRPVQAQRLVARIKKALAVRHVRVAGDLRRRVERVALCAGSGGKLVADAARAGCQLYLTADVGHHQAVEAVERGLVVVDAGHAATEAPAIPVLARRLRALCPDVTFIASAAGASGPLRTV